MNRLRIGRCALGAFIVLGTASASLAQADGGGGSADDDRTGLRGLCCTAEFGCLRTTQQSCIYQYSGTWLGFNASCYMSDGDARADINQDGEVNPDDLGDFITGYFLEPPARTSDFNHDEVVDPNDLGDYITVYFGADIQPHCY